VRIAEYRLDSRDGDDDNWGECTVVELVVVHVVAESYKAPEKHLPWAQTCCYHATPEDISVDYTVVDPCTQDVAGPPKVVVVLGRVVMTSGEHVEVVVSILWEGHNPLLVVDYVQVYDTAIAVRHCCYSPPNIPLPSCLSSRKQPLKKKWSAVASDFAFNF